MALQVIIPTGLTEVTVNGLHQWDYGREIEIRADNLPGLVEVHFACSSMETAVVRSCALINGAVTAEVPDICLEQTTPIWAWVYAVGETSGETILTIKLPITPRTKPQPGEPIPEDVSDKYTEAIAAMNGLVEEIRSIRETMQADIKSDVVDELKTGEIVANKAEWSEETAEAQHAQEADTALKDAEGNDLKNLVRFTEDGYTTYEEGDTIEAGILMVRVGSRNGSVGGTSVFITETGSAGVGGVRYSPIYYDGNHETFNWPARLAFTPVDDNKLFTITPECYLADTGGVSSWGNFSSSTKPTILYKYLVKYPAQ